MLENTTLIASPVLVYGTFDGLAEFSAQMPLRGKLHANCTQRARQQAILSTDERERFATLSLHACQGVKALQEGIHDNGVELAAGILLDPVPGNGGRLRRFVGPGGSDRIIGVGNRHDSRG